MTAARTRLMVLLLLLLQRLLLVLVRCNGERSNELALIIAAMLLVLLLLTARYHQRYSKRGRIRNDDGLWHRVPCGGRGMRPAPRLLLLALDALHPSPRLSLLCAGHTPRTTTTAADAAVMTATLGSGGAGIVSGMSAASMPAPSSTARWLAVR